MARNEISCFSLVWILVYKFAAQRARTCFLSVDRAFEVRNIAQKFAAISLEKFNFDLPNFDIL